MTDIAVCPRCHLPVRPTDYFCSNCGKNLHEPPPPTDVGHQIMVYLVSLFLPPFGIIYAIRYFRFPVKAPRIVAGIAVLLTVVSCALLTLWTINLIHAVDLQVNQQMQNLQGM